eukprot:Em0023g198a
MSSLKIKGRQKPKHPPTPYERTKRLVSKVRDWLSPVLWGTPKARSEEDEEADRELDENNEINTDVSEQLQQSGTSRAQSNQGSRAGGEVTEPVKDDGDSFVKEASDDDDDESTPMDKQNLEARPPGMPTGVRLTGGFDNGIRLEAAAEVSALQLDRKVNQLLVRSRTPVGKSLFGTPVEEVQGNQRHTAPFLAQSCSQLSYVNNCEEEHLHRSSTPADTTMDSVPPAVPHSVPPAPSAQPFERLFSQSAISTPGRTDTEESIKNSPFQSPFYRGKTSYGGASALPQPKAKRQRTELTSALSQVVHYTVKARSSSEQQPVASQTAKKILQTLETLSTPLSDARKFPLRITQLGGVGQPAKRLKHDPTSTVGGVSSPPTTPLVIPFNHSKQQGPVIVPSLDRARSPLAPKAAIVPSNRVEPSPPWLNLPNKTLKLPEPGSIGTPLPASSSVTTSMPVTSLAAIKFSPSVDTLQDKPAAFTLRSNQPSSSSSSSLPDLSFGPGPLKSLVSSSSSDPILGEQLEESVNTMEPPPPIPLTIGSKGSLPKFSFVPSLVVSTVTSTSTSSSVIPVSLSKPVADVTKMGSAFGKPLSLPMPPLKPMSSFLPVAVKSMGPSLGGQFAFSAPKELAPISQPRPPEVATKVPVFTFSAPKSCQTPAIQSSLPYLRPAASKSTEVTKVPPPLLANGSVLDALKKPEFKPFGKGPSVSGTKKESIIDLTDDENRGGDEVEVHKPLQLVPLNDTTTNSSSLFGKAAELKTSDNSPTQSSALKLGLPESSSQLFGGGGGGLKIGGLSGPTVSSSQPSTGLSGGLKIGGLSGPTVSSSQPSTGLSGGLKIGGLSGPTVSSSQPSTGLSGGLKIGGLSGLPIGGTQPSLSLGGGLKLGGLSGLTLPTPSAAARQEKSSEVPPASSVASKLPPLSGPLLVPPLPSGSWECSCCMLQNKPEATSCIACGSAKPTSSCTSQLATDATKSIALSGSIPLQAGGAPSGLDNLARVKEIPNLSESKLLTALTPSSGWECEVCLVMNKAEDLKCVACCSSKTGATTGGSSSSSGDLFQQKPQATPPVVFGDGGGIKLSLGGGLMIAGVASLSSSASKIDAPPVNDGLQLGSSKSGKEETTKTAESKLPSQPLGTTSFGARVGTSSDESGESSKALLGGSLFAVTKPQSGEVTGGIKFAVPPASQGSAVGSNISTSQPPLSFNLNALASSTSRVQGASNDGGGGSGQKPFQLSGVGVGSLATTQPNSLFSSSAYSAEPRPALSGISFAVSSYSGSTSVEPTIAASTIKLAAAPLQGTSSSIGLFSAQPPALTFAGSFGSTASQPSVLPSFVGAPAVAPTLGAVPSSQQSLLTFGASSNLQQPSSLMFGATLNPPQLSKPSAPLFAGASNPFLSQPSPMPPLVGPALSSSSSSSSMSLFTVPRLPAMFSSISVPASCPQLLILHLVQGLVRRLLISALLQPAPSAVGFGTGGTASLNKPLAGSFPSNLDTLAKAPLFPQMAAGVNPQTNAGLVFGASSQQLQQIPQGSGVTFSSTPSFTFSGMAAGQQQMNAAPMFGGSGLVGTSLITGQQLGGPSGFGGGGAGQNVPQFSVGGGVPSLAGVGGPQFGETPLFTAGQAQQRVFKKAVRKKH